MDGQRLRQKRKELGLSGEAIAKALNTTKVTVSRWESGVSEPSDKKKVALARILNTSVAYLMGETNNPDPLNHTEVIDTPPKEEEQNSAKFAYWGGVVDEVHNLVTRGDEREISLIAPLITLAYEMLTKRKPSSGTFAAQMPILGGNHNKNTQNVNITTA